MTREQDVAWAAGLFEGEGSAMVVVVSGHKVARLALPSTDLDVLKRFRDVMGEGRITGPSQRGHNKPIWSWDAQEAAAVIRCLRLLCPYLGERRSIQAERALVAAWQVIGRKVTRYTHETLFGYEVRGHAFAALGRALGEESHARANR